MKTTALKQFDLLCDGDLLKPKKYFDAINPSTGEVFARIADASAEEMRTAIMAARHAFDEGPWKDLSFEERGGHLKKITQLIRDYAKELADLEMLDAGKTSKHANFIDVPTAADTFEYYSRSEVTSPLQPRENVIDAPVKSTTQYEPRGVIGSICAYNYPLIYAAWKIAPAIIAGNTIVLKPSPLACASIMKLGALIAQTDLPEGVINIVSTTDDAVSTELVKSDKIDMVSFTGSTQTGQKVMQTAGQTTKKVCLELSAKSPTIVFDDCDKKSALGGVLSGIFLNQGQMCTAGSRLLLQESIYDEFVDQLVTRTKALKIGEASDYATEFGPLTSQAQRDLILERLKQAVNEGATLLCGGKIPEETPEAGFYLEPTILTNVNNDAAIAREEIFGPVLVVMKFSDEKEALRLANDSKYGLAASVWTKDEAKAQRVSDALQCGTVWVNTYGGFYNQAPFGGYKQSGFGRELGPEGLLEYTQTKHVCVDQTPGGMPLVASWY